MELIAARACFGLLALFTLFVLGLTCCGGPYVRGTYRQGSLRKSFWQARTLSQDHLETASPSEDGPEKETFKEANDDNAVNTVRNLLTLRD